MLTLPFAGKTKAVETRPEDVETVTTVVQTFSGGQPMTKKVTKVIKKKRASASNKDPEQANCELKPRRTKSMAAQYASSLSGETDSASAKTAKIASLPQTLRSIPAALPKLGDTRKALKTDLFRSGENVTVHLNQGTQHKALRVRRNDGDDATMYSYASAPAMRRVQSGPSINSQMNCFRVRETGAGSQAFNGNATWDSEMSLSGYPTQMRRRVGTRPSFSNQRRPSQRNLGPYMGAATPPGAVVLDLSALQGIAGGNAIVVIPSVSSAEHLTGMRRRRTGSSDDLSTMSNPVMGGGRNASWNEIPQNGRVRVARRKPDIDELSVRSEHVRRMPAQQHLQRTGGPLAGTGRIKRVGSAEELGGRSLRTRPGRKPSDELSRSDHGPLLSRMKRGGSSGELSTKGARAARIRPARRSIDDELSVASDLGPIIGKMKRGGSSGELSSKSGRPGRSRPGRKTMDDEVSVQSDLGHLLGRAKRAGSTGELSTDSSRSRRTRPGRKVVLDELSKSDHGPLMRKSRKSGSNGDISTTSSHSRSTTVSKTILRKSRSSESGIDVGKDSSGMKHSVSVGTGLEEKKKKGIMTKKKKKKQVTSNPSRQKIDIDRMLVGLKHDKGTTDQNPLTSNANAQWIMSDID